MHPSAIVSTLDSSRVDSSLPLPCVNRATTVKNNKKQKTRRKQRGDSALSCRVRRDSRVYNLTLDINDLRQEIHNLALQRQLVQTRALYESRVTSDCSVVRKAAHYFQGFARGFRGQQTHVSQDAFVRSIAGEDFSIGVTGLGVDMLA